MSLRGYELDGGLMKVKEEYDVACLGAGISGIVAAHELAKAGYKVCLISKRYGGNIADHVNWFPDDNCEMCKASDQLTCLKENFSGRDLYENSTVRGWNRKGKKFEIEVSLGYITDDCIKCGLCVEICPKGAIYLNREWDRKYSLDKERCDGCGKCLEVCPEDAIALEGIDEKIEAKAIVDARGFDLFDYSQVKSYRGEKGKTMSAQEFDYALSSLDLRGKRIAFINCVGCREKERDYCSSACCMISIKEAMRAVDKGAEPKIFYMDLRLMGKGYQRYYEESIKKGVKYKRARIGEIDNDKVVYSDLDEGEEVKEESFDYIVLSTAQVVEDGWLDTTDQGEGVFTIGSRRSPSDLRDSVISALAGAAEAMSYLGRRTRTSEPRPEVEGGWELFFCTCGDTLKAPDIEAHRVKDLCKDPSLLKGKNAIVAACSPSNYASLFISWADRCEVVDIRETGYWAGAGEEEIRRRIEVTKEKLARSGGLLPSKADGRKTGKFLIVGDTIAGRECREMLKQIGYECDLKWADEIAGVEYLPEIRVNFSGGTSVYDSAFLTSSPVPSQGVGEDLREAVKIRAKKVVILLDKECSSIRHYYPLALDRAIELREGGADVFVIFRQMCSYGLYERLYTKAREMGVVFIRADSCSVGDGRITVKELGEDLVIGYDLLLEARALDQGEENEKLAELFDLELDEGFIVELDYKFAPLLTKRKNALVGGFAAGPCNQAEEILAGKAGALLMVNSLQPVETLKARVNERRCVGCELCISACPYGARIMDHERKISQVIDELCMGCGACIAACANNACYFDDKGMISMIDCALEV